MTSAEVLKVRCWATPARVALRSAIPRLARVKLTLKRETGIRFSSVVSGIGLVGELFACVAVRWGGRAVS